MMSLVVWSSSSSHLETNVVKTTRKNALHSLSRARRKRDRHLYQSYSDDAFFITTTTVKIQKKQAEEAGKRAKAAKASSEDDSGTATPKKSPGEIRLAKGMRARTLLLSPRIFDDFSSRFGRTEARKRDGDQVSEREERLNELSDRNQTERKLLARRHVYVYVQNPGFVPARTAEGFVRPESLPSKLGHAREHLPERFARRLEPGTNGDERHFWFAVFVHRSKRERPVE